MSDKENEIKLDAKISNNAEIQLKKLIVQQEKVITRLNRELELLTDNSHNMKNEIRIVSDSERFKTEELENAEKEIVKLKEEIKFFQDSNKELVNSIDEVERTLQELESSHVHISHDGSHSDNSHLKQSKRALMEENERLIRDLAQYEARLKDMQMRLERADCDKSITQKKLETAESNIEILNETLEFMGDENIHFKGILKLIN